MKFRFLIAAIAVVLATTVSYRLVRQEYTSPIAAAKTPASIGEIKTATERVQQARAPASVFGGTPIAPPSDVIFDPKLLTRDERADIEEGVRFVYGRTVRGLKLSEEHENLVWRYLIERREAARIAKQIAIERQLREPLPELISVAQRQVDTEYERTLPKELFERVQVMATASLYLNELNQSYSRALADNGVPLSDEQLLPLARAFLASYGEPGDERGRSRPDGTGFRPADHELMRQAEAILSSQQLVAFRAELLRRNAHAGVNR